MESRRKEILDAALEVFLECGFDGTTLAAIRDRSGASTGSIYHFFSGKAGIAAALLTEATEGWGRVAGDAIGRSDAEAAIKATIRGLLDWGAANPRLFLFMDELLTRARSSREFAIVGEIMMSGRDRARAVYEGWADEGVVRACPWPVAYALMMGPAYALLREAGGAPVAQDDVETIVEASWQSVRRR